MATFPTAPGVHVTEKDLSTIVPAVSTTDGALVGYFKWGPVEDIKLISSQEDLSNAFGKPYRNANGTFFWSASNFLDYSNRIHVMRVSDGTNATWDGTAATVLNDADYVLNLMLGLLELDILSQNIREHWEILFKSQWLMVQKDLIVGV